MPLEWSGNFTLYYYAPGKNQCLLWPRRLFNNSASLFCFFDIFSPRNFSFFYSLNIGIMYGMAGYTLEEFWKVQR